MPTRNVMHKLVLFTAWYFFMVVGGVLYFAPPTLYTRVPFMTKAKNIFLVCAVALVLYVISHWCFCHKIWNGLRYALSVARLEKQTRKQLYDAHIYSTGNFFGTEVADMPDIIVQLDKMEMNTGQVSIEASLKNAKKIEDVSLSPALGRFVVTDAYWREDENYFVYEIEDYRIGSGRYSFDSPFAYSMFASHLQDYHLFINKKYNLIPLHHALLTGQTGGGKSIALIQFICQTYYWSNEVRPIFFFADGKMSGVYKVGRILAPQRTANKTQDIIRLLEKFVKEIERREEEYLSKSIRKIDSTFMEWRLRPFIFVLEEAGDFLAKVEDISTKEKKHVKSMMSTITMMGREVGCFLWCAMQVAKADALDSSIRANMPIKVALGKAETSVYVTIFGHSKELPIKNFLPGSGLFDCPGITRMPSFVGFPKLGFDYIELVTQFENRNETE